MAEIANNSIDIQVVDTGGDTAQYFWHNTVDSGAGEGAGAHITELPKGDFVADPANGGANTLIDSTTMHIRDGITDLAEFSDDGLKFTARNGQETFSIACDNSSITENIRCKTSNNDIPYNEVTVSTFPRLQLADTGAIIKVQIQAGTTSPVSTTFTKGTSETKTIASGVAITYDGDYSFSADNQNTYEHDFHYYFVSFSKTWYGTIETLRGDAIIDGDATIYGDATMGGGIDAYGSLSVRDIAYLRSDVRIGGATRFGTPDMTFIVDQHETGTLTGNGAHDDEYLTITKPGCYPVGIVGYEETGTLTSFLHLYATFITDATVGSGKIRFNRRVTGYSGSTTLSGKVIFSVLWVRV